MRSRLKRERRQAAIYVPAGLLPQVAQGEREETETEGAEDAPAFDAGRQRDRAGEEGEGAGLLGRLYGGFDALRPAAVPPPTPAAAASAAAADATPDTRHSKRQRLAGSPLPGEQEQQVQAPLGNGHLAGLAGVAAPEGATAAAAAAAGGPLPLQADWLLLYQRLDGLLTRSGVDPVQAQVGGWVLAVRGLAVRGWVWRGPGRLAYCCCAGAGAGASACAAARAGASPAAPFARCGSCLTPCCWACCPSAVIHRSRPTHKIQPAADAAPPPQRYKLTLLNTLNTTEELARSHFYE